MFHRIDDWRTLDGPRFCMLAARLPFYEGVVRARVMAQAHGHHTDPGVHTPAEVTSAAAVTDPLLAGLVSFGDPTDD